MKAKENFSYKVYQAVKKIPWGKVATYGQIAKRLGKPKAARVVGNVLHKNPYPDVPCHRVANRNGKLAVNYRFGGWKGQKKKLTAEGIRFKDKNRVKLDSCL